jgi:hypothetical protein
VPAANIATGGATLAVAGVARPIVNAVSGPDAARVSRHERGARAFRIGDRTGVRERPQLEFGDVQVRLFARSETRSRARAGRDRHKSRRHGSVKPCGHSSIEGSSG